MPMRELEVSAGQLVAGLKGQLALRTQLQDDICELARLYALATGGGDGVRAGGRAPGGRAGRGRWWSR